MAGIENNIIFGGGFKLSDSSPTDISNMQRDPTDISTINYSGNPEGVISANPSSFCHDPVSGLIYRKASGTGNTGWAVIDAGSINRDAFNAYVGSSIANFTGGGLPSQPIPFDTVTVNKNGWYDPVSGLYMPGRDSIYCLTYSVTFFGGDATTSELKILWNGIAYNYFGTQEKIVGDPTGNLLTYTSTIIIPILVGHFMRVAVIATSNIQNVGIYGTTPITGEVYASTFSGAELCSIT